MSKPDANGWQPIETAPRSGEYFLGCNGEGIEIVSWAFDENEWGFRVEATFIGANGGSSGYMALWPELTHWQPLPGPPVEEQSS